MSGQLLHSGILGVGSYVPEKILTNKEMEKIVETSDEWIVSRTGIKERRLVVDNETTTELALKAATIALENSGVKPEEIDLIIVATSTPEHFFPATACAVQSKLGCVHAGAFDLLAGCSGFVYAMVVAEQFISTGKSRHVLVIGSEVLSKVTNWQDRSTCVLFGDGAGAAVLGPVAENTGILASQLASEGDGGNLLTLPTLYCKNFLKEEENEALKPYITMNGKEVFRFAVRVMEDGTREVLDKAGLTIDDVDLFIPHQANTRIIDHAVKKLNLPPDKVMINVDKYGNTSAASVPIALDEAYRQGRIKSGDNVVLMAFGAGLTWAASLIRWV